MRSFHPLKMVPFLLLLLALLIPIPLPAQPDGKGSREYQQAIEKLDSFIQSELKTKNLPSIAIALVDFPAGDTDVRVGFFSDTPVVA